MAESSLTEAKEDRHTNKRGFTLLELLLAVAVLGIIGSIVLVRYSQRVASFSVESAVRETKYFFDLAKDYSVAKNQEITVSFNLSNDSIGTFHIIGPIDKKGTSGILDVLEISKFVSVTANTTAKALTLSPHQPIKFASVNDGNLTTQNFVLTFSNKSQRSQKLVIYSTSGSSQIE